MMRSIVSAAEWTARFVLSAPSIVGPAGTPVFDEGHVVAC